MSDLRRRTPHPAAVAGWLAVAAAVVFGRRSPRPTPTPATPAAPLLAPPGDTVARHHPPVTITSEWLHDPVEVLASPADTVAGAAATATPATKPDWLARLPRPLAALRGLASPLIMPRLQLPRVLTPDFPALRALAARARPNQPVHVTLTAYCLKGTTRQGTPTRAGIIAADPRVFPMAHHVHLFSAGRYLGRFRVEDTGGGVHGPRIDIWTPDCADAARFGTRPGVASLVSFGE